MSGAPPEPILHSRFDQWMTHLYPSHQPTSQLALRLGAYAMGANDDNLQDYIEKLDQKWDRFFNQFPDGRPPILGVGTLHFLLS